MIQFDYIYNIFEMGGSGINWYLAIFVQGKLPHQARQIDGWDLLGGDGWETSEELMIGIWHGFGLNVWSTPRPGFQSQMKV